MYFDSVFALVLFLGLPVLLLLRAIRRAPRDREYGRLGEWTVGELGVVAAFALMAAWLGPGLLAGRDWHVWEVAGLGLSGILACAVLTWCARYPNAGGLSAALGGLIGVSVSFWAVAVLPDQTGQSGVGLLMIIVGAGLVLWLVALFTADVRMRADR